LQFGFRVAAGKPESARGGKVSHGNDKGLSFGRADDGFTDARRGKDIAASGLHPDNNAADTLLQERFTQRANDRVRARRYPQKRNGEAAACAIHYGSLDSDDGDGVAEFETLRKLQKSPHGLLRKPKTREGFPKARIAAQLCDDSLAQSLFGRHKPIPEPGGNALRRLSAICGNTRKSAIAYTIKNAG